MKIHLRAICCFVLLLSAGCLRARASQAHVDGGAEAAPSVAAAAGDEPDAQATPRQASPPEKVQYVASYAMYRADVLSECTEFILELGDSAADGGLDRARADAAAEEIFKNIEKNSPKPKPTRLQERCTTTLSDRVELARCEASLDLLKGKNAPSGRSAGLTIAERYYDFGDVGLSDRRMRECLEDHGRWTALNRNSDEWKLAKLQHDTTKLRRAMKDFE